MNSSTTSFYSESAQQLDPDQAAKLKKLANPFSTMSKKNGRETPSAVHPSLQGMTRPEDIDDMLSELSTPGLGEDDLAAQKRYIDSLINRGKQNALVANLGGQDKEE